MMHNFAQDVVGLSYKNEPNTPQCLETIMKPEVLLFSDKCYVDCVNDDDKCFAAELVSGDGDTSMLADPNGIGPASVDVADPGYTITAFAVTGPGN